MFKPLVIFPYDTSRLVLTLFLKAMCYYHFINEINPRLKVFCTMLKGHTLTAQPGEPHVKKLDRIDQL